MVVQKKNNVEPKDIHWRLEAACSDKSELFDADENDQYPHEYEAKQICKDCPVFVQCNRDLRTEPYGIVWGTTHLERFQ